MQLRARCHVAESRAELLAEQLRALAEVVGIQEVMHCGDVPAAAERGLRQRMRQLVDAAVELPQEGAVRTLKQLAVKELENERIEQELAVYKERELAARGGYQRATDLLKSSLQGASRTHRRPVHTS